MGNFANSLFSVLLGWAQSAVAWVWQLFGSGGADGMAGWLLDNWLLLVIVLCALGVAIDLVVYLIRWQPYRVWRSFWQRKEAEDAEDQPGQEQLQWLYADGKLVTEEAPESAPAQPAADMQLDAPVRPVQRVIPARHRRTAEGSEGYVLPSGEVVQQAYHQPYYPPQWHSEEQQTTNGGTNP